MKKKQLIGISIIGGLLLTNVGTGVYSYDTVEKRDREIRNLNGDKKKLHNELNERNNILDSQQIEISTYEEEVKKLNKSLLSKDEEIKKLKKEVKVLKKKEKESP